MLSPARKRILLVEDEALLAITETMQLEKYGYAVRTVTNGEKAVEAVKASHDIDLILMDINLGSGIDGTEAAEIILKDHDIPVVFLSSHTDPEVVEKTEKITSYGYVVKNSNITVLDASIKMAFKLFEAKRILSEKEAALSYKHDFMSYVIEHSSSAIAVHDSDLNYLYVSQQYLDSYRVKERDLIGRHHYEVFPDLPQKWRDAHQRALRGEVLRGENDPFERADGSIDVTTWECRPWYEQDGTIGGIIVYTEVINDQKKKEEELRRFKIISDNAVYGNVIADLDGNLVYVNSFFARIHGYEPDDLIGKHLSLFHNEQQLNAVEQLNASVVRTGSYAPSTVWHCHKDGTEFPMLMSGVLLTDDNGNPQYVAASAVDMSFQKQAEDRYRLLFNLSNDAIFVHKIGEDNGPGRNIEVNEQASRMLGYSRDELLTMSARDLVPQKHAPVMFRHGQELMKTKHLTFETENVRRDGVVIPVEVSAHLHTEGNRRFVVSSVRDITERSEAQNQVRKLAAENETLLRELQHRIKNNLNTMTSLLSLQAQTLTEPAAIAALVYARNRLHSLGLLYDHLYFSGTYAESSLREYLSHLVTSEVRLFPRGEHVAVHLEIEEYVCPAETLSTLGLIVNELVTNAMKYAFPDHPNPELTITGVRHDLHYVLTIGDNGTGPCEPVQRNPSSGSGTMIVDALTEALDGTIKTENDGGTRVTLDFPIAEKQM